LAELLARERVKLVIADVNEARAAVLTKSLGAKQVGGADVPQVEADIFAPCAFGAVLNDLTIPRLKARLVCGGANNQLQDEQHGEALRQCGIVYAPDYIVNAGGIINIAAEYLGENTPQGEVRVGEIAPRILSILRDAAASGLPSNVVADDLAHRTVVGAHRDAA